MSGHNHSRLGQPNTNWDSLQIPTYIPRQPQLAHMSSERSLVRSPPTWHTPTPTDSIYSLYANNHNHKSSLELNPHLTSFNLRPTSPMGSVDLSISGASKSSSSASPKNLNSPGSIHVSSGSVNKCLRKSPTPSVIQSTANVKDRSSKSFSNAAENNTTGGLIVKDAKQINNDVEKLTRGDIKLHPSPEAILRMKNNGVPIKSPKQNLPNDNTIANNKNSSNKSPSDIIIETNTNKSLLPSSPKNLYTIPLTPVVSTSVIGNNTSDINNISNNSNDDTLDSNSGKKRRRRKPNKTTRMTNENEVLKYSENITDDEDIIKNADTLKTQNDNNNLVIVNGQKSDEKFNVISEKVPDRVDIENGDYKNDKIQKPNNNNHTSNITNDINKLEIINKVSPTNNVVLDDKNQRNDTKLDETPKQNMVNSKISITARTTDDSDDCETIDKIAEMISNTSTESDLRTKQTTEPEKSKDDKENIVACPIATTSLPEASLPLPEVQPTEVKLNGIPMNEKFEDVENKLEEMFAGIEENEEPKIEPNASQVKPTSVSEDLPSSKEIVKENTNPVKKSNKRKITNGKSDSGSPVRKKKASSKRGGKNCNVNNKNTGKNAKKNGSKLNKSNNQSKVSVKDDSTATENGISMAKYKGPFVQVKLDGSLNIINAPINEDDTDKPQNKIKKSIHSNNSERNKIRGMHVSTLSMKYDADTTDASWMCVYCKMGPHKSNLGDLFGPYIVTTNCEEFKASQYNTIDDLFNAKRTKESMASKNSAKKINEEIGPSTSGTQPKKKRKSNEPVINATVNPVATTDIIIPNMNIFYGMTKVDETSYEVWMHEDCAVWAPGVHIIGARVVGLDESIWESCKHKCSICSNYGAMLSCLKRGCTSTVHVACGRKNKWNLTDEFKCFCEVHHESS